MSGIVGILSLDGAPVDRLLLEQMTGSLAFRGPDAQETWADGPVGFGHTLLRTTEESAGERQPHSLDGRVWITADARIDDRANLVGTLAARGRQAAETDADGELILHAYHVWGERCVDHLLGDFAFAIWDGTQQRLFCARDHFGVKPFFYARVDSALVFSNTLNCLRRHPAVSDRLNDLAIADFLIFPYPREPAPTVFADIRRLPAAHCLTCQGERHRLRRYWALPADGRIRYRRAGEYVERFQELLRTAVRDRLRTRRVAVMMSGGLDSTSIAATARELLRQRRAPFDLRAFTDVYDRLIPDRERHFSGLAATALGIPIHHLPLDDYKPYDRWEEPALHTPEPIHYPLLAGGIDHYRQIALHSRLALTGEGGDSVFAWSPSYFRDLLRNRRVGQAAAEVLTYLLAQRRLPPFGTGLRSRWRRGFGKAPAPHAYPPWLNQDLATRLDLRARWQRLIDGTPAEPTHSQHPQAYEELADPYWQIRFETYDPGLSRAPVEIRHPFFDVRLVNYLLALPPMPWCVDKELLRAAMRGRLPETVRRRPKARLGGSPDLEHCRAGWGQRLDQFDPDPELTRFVARDAIPSVAGDDDTLRQWVNLRPLSLNYWFRFSFRKEHGRDPQWHPIHDPAGPGMKAASRRSTTPPSSASSETSVPSLRAEGGIPR
jgi:asparagine synthase (glutamine-hydrolysing)